MWYPRKTSDYIQLIIIWWIWPMVLSGTKNLGQPPYNNSMFLWPSLSSKKVPCFPTWRFASISQESFPSTMWLDSCRVPWRKVSDRYPRCNCPQQVWHMFIPMIQLDLRICFFFRNGWQKTTNYVGPYWDMQYIHYYINLKWFAWQISETSTALTLFDYNHLATSGGKCWMYYSTSSEWKKFTT